MPKRKLRKAAKAEKLDASTYEAAKEWVERSIVEFGHVDILATCIGWFDRGFTLFKDQVPAQWPQMVAEQFWPHVFLTHALLPHLIHRGAGRIIALGSDGAKGGQSGVAIACAGNGGLISFSKSLAREVGRHGITVNVVCAGPTDTPALKTMLDNADLGSKLVEGAIRSIPLKRVGHPREVAAVFAFLASDAGGYVTGQALSASGGLTMM